ncbi:uncharacterized protein MELLADRAFT_62716 [Melampsora larici-populina 98AG31]|uniref:Uncharacterized protein n=1 Tax=Melampsora larici-populina (strain 98AG31 / pathotype 3-4-7) TaxID=747676 RepID=F4RJY4_MELLP|nr:uncharacterized protein MELLADRAFT_62716 [Melampsora larici-populina 98AG31]EGG07392.1 hypothetical protein MELLADRAFT_62716 [Melampsora larici-populina 98AG31]
MSDTPERGGGAETSGTNNWMEGPDPPENPNTRPAKKQPKGKARAKSVGPIQIKPLTRQQEQIKVAQEKEADAQARLLEERGANERAARRIQELEKMLKERDESEGGGDKKGEDEEGGNEDGWGALEGDGDGTQQHQRNDRVWGGVVIKERPRTSQGTTFPPNPPVPFYPSSFLSAYQIQITFGILPSVEMPLIWEMNLKRGQWDWELINPPKGMPLQR